MYNDCCLKRDCLNTGRGSCHSTVLEGWHFVLPDANVGILILVIAAAPASSDMLARRSDLRLVTMELQKVKYDAYIV